MGTILGANPHISVYDQAEFLPNGQVSYAIETYEPLANLIADLPGVIHAQPVIRAQVMATHLGRNAGVEVVGVTQDDLQRIPLVANPETMSGDITQFQNGVAIGWGVARELGLNVGDTIRLISPDGPRTPFGTSPRISNYEVTYIFRVGRWDIDRIRVYMPFEEAQIYFNREGVADAIEVTIENPEQVMDQVFPILEAVNAPISIGTWQDSSGAFLRALEMEDNVMFIILSILVLIATMNIVSGLIMLVKNKSRDIGILRTMGLSQGSILRVFFICGSSIGVAGTVLGVILGCSIAIWIDQIVSFLNFVLGGGVWDPSIRQISELPARLQLGDVLSAVFMALGLSFGVTIFPARRAARMNPVEALRYE